MLRELRLENYAVIDQVQVEFSSGLNLLTGETGAGKSILIDALALLLGEKASPDVVRHGESRALLSAVFELEGDAERRVHEVLDANGLDSAEGTVILRREIASESKSRVFINNQAATVGVLKQLAPHLANIHAQNETLANFDAATRLDLLDEAGSCALDAVARAFAAWKQLRDHIAELERDEKGRLQLLDMWSFQKREIEDARLTPNEDEKLEAEKRVLANAEKIYAAAMGAFDLLYEGENSAAARLRGAIKHLEELARFEPKFVETVQALEAARINIEDVGASLPDYAGGVEASPDRLEAIEDRLALLDRLKRKYGPRLDDVIVLGDDMARKVSEMENKDEILGRLRKELGSAANVYFGEAATLSGKRKEAARKLEKRVEIETNDLAMNARFQIEIHNSLDASGADSGWTPHGFDQVVFMIATNPGEPLRRLEQIASGGELSRVMLALKVSVERLSEQASRAVASGRKKSSSQRTLVFDEIDTGIGGRAAEAVGRKLKELSRAAQLLCVTHLPQIAAFADQHYRIQKKESAGRTQTSIQLLAPVERTEEVARMLSGTKLTETSLKHAEQMLKTAQ